MNPTHPAEALRLSIAAVERETRIGKDTLRVWERRYGFPQPERDAHGERLYPPEQVERLHIVRRLLDGGHRPGRVVPLDLASLRELGQTAPEARRAQALSAAPGAAEGKSSATAAEAAEELQAWMLLVRSHVPARLRRALGQALLRRGLASFVVDLAIPFMHAVGEAWAQGRLAVFEEHLASDVLETTLRSALAATPEPGTASAPRVLLSTLQGETHGLGLLMADALFSVEGCACMNLGCQTPAQELAAAARAHRADIVVLSSSAAANPAKVAEALAELRALLPASVELWAGMPHAGLRRRGVPGALLLDRLDSIAAQVQRWRTNR